MELPGGACLLVLNDQGQALIVTRPNKADSVCMPGGKVEAGETFAQAMVREVREETGLSITEDRLFELFRSPCVGDGGAPRYDVTCFVLLDTVATIPGPEEPDLEARFDDPAVLLTHSPFAEYNREALEAFLAVLPALVAEGKTNVNPSVCAASIEAALLV